VGDGRRLAWLVAIAAIVLFGPVAAWAQESATARVRVRGPGASAVERVIARVLASSGYRVATSRRRGAALRVTGRVDGADEGGPVTVHLAVRAGGALVARVRARGASRRAALERMESKLAPAVEAARARRGGARADRRADAREPAEGEGEREYDFDDAADDDDGAAADANATPAAVAAAPAAKPSTRPPARRRAARRRPVPARRTAARVEVESTPRGSAPADAAAGSDVSASAPEPGERARAPWVSIAVGPELYGRHFSYRDDLFQELQEYDVTATPAVTATATIYPMARGSRGALAGLGLAGAFTHVPSFDSEDGAGGQYTSEARSYALGARYRHAILGVEVAGALDYGSQSFSIASSGDMPAPDFPGVNYRYLRAGLGVSAPLWSRYSIAAAAGYRQVLSSGQIESDDFFPRSSARAFDADLELSAALAWGFDVRVGAALERYGHDLQPEPGDARVAGGALDQYLRLFLRLGYTY
jgi:hypothetical protein